MIGSKLLLEESPLLVIPSLAKRIGLNEAIVLQQINFLINGLTANKIERNYKQGFYWVDRTYEEWESAFPWWSIGTIRRVLGKLESSGILVTGAFSKTLANRARWYRIDYQALRNATREDATHPELPSSDQSDQNSSDQIDQNCSDQSDQNSSDQIDQNFYIEDLSFKEIKKEREERKSGSEAETAARAFLDFEENPEPNPEPSPKSLELALCQKSDRPTEANSPQPPVPRRPLPRKLGRKNNQRPSAASVYPTLKDLATFEKLWAWYCQKCRETASSPGDKVLAAIAWRDTIEPFPGLIDEFRKGAALFFKHTTVGIPHLERFISGSEIHPTPYWQSALDAAAVTSAGEFIQESATPPTALPLDYVPPVEERNIEANNAAIAKARAEIAQALAARSGHGS